MQHDNTQHCLHNTVNTLYKVLEPGSLQPSNMETPSYPALPPLIPAPFFPPTPLAMTSSPHNVTSPHMTSSPHNIPPSHMASSPHNMPSHYSMTSSHNMTSPHNMTSSHMSSPHNMTSPHNMSSSSQKMPSSSSYVYPSTPVQESYTSDECSCSDSSENSLQLDKQLDKLKCEQERIQMKINQLTECPDLRREEKKARDRARTARYRSAFSEEERREYREKQRLFQQERRQKESPEERKRRLERSAERQRMKRQNYTDEQKIRMKEINRMRTRERRARETEEQREIRKIKDRIRMREKRALIKQVSELGPEIVARSCVQVLDTEQLRGGQSGMQTLGLVGNFSGTNEFPRLSNATFDLASQIASQLIGQVPHITRPSRDENTSKYMISDNRTQISPPDHQLFLNKTFQCSSSTSTNLLQNTEPFRRTDSDNDSISDNEDVKRFPFSDRASSSNTSYHDPLSNNLLRNISLPNNVSQSNVLRSTTSSLPSVKNTALFSVAKHYLSEEHQKYLLHKEKQRIMRQVRRRSETSEERAQRLEKAAQRQRNKRQSLTEAEREKTKEMNRIRAQQRRSEETAEQRVERREREKVRRREQRALKKLSQCSGNTPASFISCSLAGAACSSANNSDHLHFNSNSNDHIHFDSDSNDHLHFESNSNDRLHFDSNNRNTNLHFDSNSSDHIQFDVSSSSSNDVNVVSAANKSVHFSDSQLEDTRIVH